MQIYYNTIEEDITPLDTAFSFEEEGDKITVSSFKGELIRSGDIYVLKGAAAFTLACPCDRCGEEAAISMTQDILVGLKPCTPAEASPEYEMNEEDGEEYFTDPEYIDLHDILRQEVLLALPVKRLCSASCEMTSYAEAAEEEAATGLASLKKLLKEN